MLRKVRKAVTLGAFGAMLVISFGCSRDHIEAVNLANAGDKLVKINARGAVSKYEEATRLDPSNHAIFWKLAMAYQKMEEWSKMESTLSRASAVAPDFADYYYYRGYALVMIAEGGNLDAYKDAKEPLSKCISTDSNYAECYHWLGQASLWTGDDQAALDNYTKAIEHDPKVGYFYPPLAELYINLRMYGEAEQVLKAGETTLDKIQKKKNALYSIYTLMFNVYQARKDLNSGVAALEKADGIAGKEHPEIAFNLGSTYAVMDPPKKDRAIRLLKSFNKRACRSSKGKTKYRSQCETSSALVQKLGG
jgi:tetratricopeptide (TPR) repeat protein